MIWHKQPVGITTTNERLDRKLSLLSLPFQQVMSLAFSADNFSIFSPPTSVSSYERQEDLLYMLLLFTLVPNTSFSVFRLSSWLV